MAIMSKLTAAYIAGFLDGEGYFGIMKRHKGRERADYLPVIKATSVDKEIIEWFYKSYGGWMNKRKFKNKNQKDAYTWVLAGKKIEPFLRKIYPYLKLKKKQADILLKRIKLYDKIGTGKRIGSGSNLKYPDEIMREIKDLYRQIRKLNKRGVSAP